MDGWIMLDAAKTNRPLDFHHEDTKRTQRPKVITFKRFVSLVLALCLRGENLLVIKAVVYESIA